MFILISPAKTLDFKTPPHVVEFSQCDWLDESAQLIAHLRKFTPAEIASLMGLSDALAALNVARYATWSRPFTPENARQAALAFAGDVYEGLDAASLNRADLAWAQTHLGILSGLYGLLRPLDLIQPYRLEMGTRLANHRGKDLYAYWGTLLGAAAKTAIAASGTPVLLNLASEEYFKAVQSTKLATVIQPVFEDWKGGKYKIISFYAKRARGLMTRYIIQNRIDEPEDLKNFDVDGYAHAPAASEGNRWVFRRG